jgi:hypothetical protein
MYLVTYRNGLSVWNADSGEFINSFAPEQRANIKISYIAISPDNTMLATVSDKSKTVELWDLPALTPRGVIDDSNDAGTYFGEVQFCPESILLVGVKILCPRKCDSFDDHEGDGATEHNVGTNDNGISDGALVPNWTTAMAEMVGMVEVDAATMVLNILEAPIVNEDDDGDRKDDSAIITGGLKIWSVASLACIFRLDIPFTITDIFYGPARQLVFMTAASVTTTYQELAVWDPEAQVVETVARYYGHMSNVDINFNADICTVSSGFSFGRSPQEVSLELRQWSQRRVKWTVAMSSDFKLFFGFFCSISADGSTVAVTTTKSRITLFAARDGSILRHMCPERREIQSVHYHPADVSGFVISYFAQSGSEVMMYDWKNDASRYRISCGDFDFKTSASCSLLL